MEIRRQRSNLQVEGTESTLEMQKTEKVRRGETGTLAVGEGQQIKPVMGQFDFRKERQPSNGSKFRREARSATALGLNNLRGAKRNVQ